MASDLSNTLSAFFQSETPNVTPAVLRAERIAAIRARRIEIRAAQVQLNQQIANYLNQNEHDSAAKSPGLNQR
ncbi:MAG: hypothetical protein V4471_06920 [Pseudomonadota bacterium]